jgi:hypothetical protein
MVLYSEVVKTGKKPERNVESCYENPTKTQPGEHMKSDFKNKPDEKLVHSHQKKPFNQHQIPKTRFDQPFLNQWDNFFRDFGGSRDVTKLGKLLRYINNFFQDNHGVCNFLASDIREIEHQTRHSLKMFQKRLAEDAIYNSFLIAYKLIKLAKEQTETSHKRVKVSSV